MLALVETAAAIAVSLYIAWRFQTVRHIAVAAVLAPMVLLRNPRSVGLGVRWAAAAKVRWFNVNRRVFGPLHDRGFPEFPLILLVGFGMLLIVPAVRVAATAAVLVTAPAMALRSIPRNWRRVVLSTDSREPPDPLPGWQAEPELQFLDFDGYRKTAFKDSEPLTSDVLYGLLLYGPALLYRWSLKSTAVVYSALLWVVWRTFDARIPVEARLRLIREWDVWRISTAYSLLVALLFVAKIGLMVGWNGFVDWWNSHRLLQAAAHYVQPAAVPPWQIAGFLSALTVLFVYLYSGYFLAHRRVGVEMNESRADAVLKLTTFLRCTLALYVWPCSVYIIVNAALGLPWPTLDTRVFPWSG